MVGGGVYSEADLGDSSAGPARLRGPGYKRQPLTPATLKGRSDILNGHLSCDFPREVLSGVNEPRQGRIFAHSKCSRNGDSEFWKLRNVLGQRHRNCSRSGLLACGGSCLALILQGISIRSSPNTSQPPQPHLSTPPSPAWWDRQIWEQRVPGVGPFQSCFLPKLLPPHPTPGAGYVAQEGHSWAKYNLGWAAVPGRDEEAGHSLLPSPWLSFLC